MMALMMMSSACDRGTAESARRREATEGGASRRAPRRIISIAPNATEMIIALGAGERLVGVSDFCRLPDSLRTLPRVGGLIDPNLERILGLKPDLVIMRGKMVEVEKLCEANGIRMYHDPTERFDDVFSTIDALGEMLECRREAEALTGALRAKIDRVTRAVANLRRPRVLFTTDRPVDALSRVTTSGRGTFVDEMITRAGGRNIFGDVDVAYPEVSLESILLAKPEVIVEVMPEAADPRGDLRSRVVDQWKHLGTMPATTSGRIHVLTDAELVIPSPRIGDAIERLARLLHPEVTFD